MNSMTVLKLLLTFLVSGGVSYLATPLVKKFAYVIGAIDVPKDNRRMHKNPIPRLGGLAIFVGFLIALLVFGTTDRLMVSILIGSLLIVTLGVLDDIMNLPAGLKLIVQIIASLIPVFYGGLRIEFFTNFVNPGRYIDLSYLSIPVTILWVVGLTNAVNWIDGLDGLAVGVSTISAVSLFVVTICMGDLYVALVMLALSGACLGFLPYNRNPAKIFMGDTGSEFLGFLLACMSVQGLFKFYAVISFAVPFLILGLPIFDMLSSIFRRIRAGKSPAAADREHIHHKLIDMGFSQKQAVAILYVITAILGVIAIVLSLCGAIWALLILLVLLIVGVIFFRLFLRTGQKDDTAIHMSSEQKKNELPDTRSEDSFSETDRND